MQRAALTAVILSWVALGVLTVARKRPPGAREVKRGRRWLAGMLVQGFAIFLVWALPRPRFAPLAPGFAGTALAALAIALAVAGVWVMVASQRALGAQFAYEARLVEGHKLVTAGPYAFVRHPIYSASTAWSSQRRWLTASGMPCRSSRRSTPSAPPCACGAKRGCCGRPSETNLTTIAAASRR